LTTPARRVAFEVVRRTFERGAWTDRAFRSTVDRSRLSTRELAQAQRLAFGSVQRRGTTDHLIERLAARPVDALDPPVVAALRLGLYDLLFSDATPAHAAVDQAVELTKEAMGATAQARRRGEAAAGLVNAVLRRAAAEGPALLENLVTTTPAEAAIALSYPEWLARMWWAELGADDALALMAAMNEPSETALRVNRLRADPVAVVEALRRAGVEAERPGAHDGGPLAPPEAVVVHGASGEEGRRRIEAGELVPQSRGSQAVVEILDPRPGERVLDLCAGPGIKTTAIAARMGNSGELIAVERDPRRASELGALAARAGAECVRVEVADARSADLGSGYDRVLVDPPCSDLGTLASRPDARWRKTAEGIERLASLQRELLASGAASLRPGGTLVYSTCTVSARENEEIVSGETGLAVDGLGTAHPELASAADPRFLQIRPDLHGTDGFFIARMRRERG
jgi:16S rRNA (cytosine967-C5)-methyltransferase